MEMGKNEHIVFSIIVPIYNAEKHLARCLDSLLVQNVRQAEFILIDDGSTDNSFQICEEYRKRDSRFIVKKNKSNLGVSRTRNCGIKLARGKYIGFVDSDDWCDPNGFGIMKKKMEETDSDFVATNGMVIFEGRPEKNRKLVCGQVNDVFSRDEAITYVFLPTGYKGFLVNKLFKRDIIVMNKLSFCENVHFCEDMCFVVQYLMHCRTGCYMDVCCYYYWIDGSNTVEKPFSDRQFSFIKAFNCIISETKDCDESVKIAIRNDYTTSCIFMIIKAIKDINTNAKELKYMQAIVKKNLRLYLFTRNISIRMKLYATLQVISLRMFKLIHG